MTDDLGFQSCPICGVRGLHGCLGPQKTTTVDPFVPIDEADPSTDEGEARCRDCGESRSSRRHGMCTHNWTCDGSCVHAFLGPGGREYKFTTIQAGISEEQAAAIRAPLEAEVERLREALTDALDTLLDYVPQRAKPYRNGWVDEWRDLAASLVYRGDRMRVQLSYEERIINQVLNNREYRRQRRGESVIEYDQRCFKALRAILQPLYDRIAELEGTKEAERE